MVRLNENQVAADAWEHAKPTGKWTEVSVDNRVLDAPVKEKKRTWTKSVRESAKRSRPVRHMLEKAASDEEREERDRDTLGDKLEAFLKRKEQEDEATGLMEEVRKNVAAAQQKILRQNKVCATLCENMSTITAEIRAVPGP